jgi:membrane fusion protein (multidrug efflux system)
VTIVSKPLPLALVALSAALLSGCSGKPEEAAADAALEAPAVNVSVQKIEPATLRDVLELAGRLEPWVEVEVSTELGGTVQEVGFEKGRSVRKGQVLARIGTDLLEASLAEAEAALLAAEANYNKTKELFDRQAVPRQELVAATSSFKQAEARTAQAKLRVERSIIESPVSGVAVTRGIELGEVVAPGSPITVVHDVSRLKAATGIPEDDISHFRVGGEVKIEVDAYPGREFRGTIHFLSPAATGQNRTFPAEIEIDNRSGELRPGMIVRVALTRRVYENAMVVPRDAILERDTGDVIFVLKDDLVELRKVATGPSEKGRIVVLEGLQPGETLVVSGHRNLVDGQKVRVVSGDKAP